MHREFLGKAGEIITDAGGKISERLGEGYHQVAKEIADNIKNFQEKNPKFRRSHSIIKQNYR